MDFLVLIHVLAGTTWFGGHVYVESLIASANRTGDAQTIASVGLRVAKVNGRLFGMAGVLVLITGTWIVLASGAYEFETLFVSIGMVLTIAALIFGFAVLKPREDEIDLLVQQNGLTDPSVMTALKKAIGLSRAMTTAVFVIIVLMVLKPGIGG